LPRQLRCLAMTGRDILKTTKCRQHAMTERNQKPQNTATVHTHANKKAQKKTPLTRYKSVKSADLFSCESPFIFL